MLKMMKTFVLFPVKTDCDPYFERGSDSTTAPTQPYLTYMCELFKVEIDHIIYETLYFCNFNKDQYYQKL